MMKIHVFFILIICDITIQAQSTTYWSPAFTTFSGNHTEYGHVEGYGVDLINFSSGKHDLAVVSLGTAVLENDPSNLKSRFWYSLYYTQTYRLLKKNRSRIKPTIGWKVGYLYMGDSSTNSANQAQGIHTLIIGPVLHLDIYLLRKLSLYGEYTGDLDLSSGFYNRFNIGLKWNILAN